VKTSGARILICDDEKLIRDLLSKALVARGFECVTAEDGRDCVDQVRVQKPDVLLLDLMMPRMDGFEFLDHFRRDPRFILTPVIVVTAKDLTEQDRARLNGRIHSLITKDGSVVKKLLPQLQAYLPRTAGADPAGKSS
jgi:CheY-like chemotaxis protein